MSEEWLLSQVILRLGGPKIVLSMFPKDTIASVDTGMKITEIPVACLAHVLSYIQLSDVRNVWSTCKAFSHAIVHYRHFWTRLIQSALEDVISIFNAKNDKQLSVFIRSINVFESFAGVEQTLRDHLEWMFRKRRWVYEDWTFASSLGYTKLIFQRQSAKNEWFTIVQARDCTQFFLSWYNRGVPTCVFKSTRYDAVFHGSLQSDEQERRIRKLITLAPDGKWIFGDGTVLEGEGVVFDNKPRFNVDLEEWKEIVKKRKVVSPPPPPPALRAGGGGGEKKEKEAEE